MDETNDINFLGDVMDLHDPFHLDAYIYFLRNGYLPQEYVDWMNIEGIKRHHPETGMYWYRYIEIKLFHRSIIQIIKEVKGEDVEFPPIC